MSSTSARGAWTLYGFSMLLVGLAVAALQVEESRQKDLLGRAAAQQQVQLLGRVVSDQLQRGQYKPMASLLKDWAAADPKVVDLGVVAQTGEVLAEFHRSARSRDLVRLDAGLEYSYASKATLNLAYDISDATAYGKHFAESLLAFYLLIAAVTANMLRLNLRRREALEELRQKTEQFDGYFNSALDLFCIASVDGRLLNLNPPWKKELGYAVAELTGRPLLDFVHEDDRRATTEALAALARQQPVSAFSNRLRHKDGSYRTLEWVIQPHDQVLYGAARDVTEKQLQEDEIRLLNRIYSTLSQTSQLIVRCTSESELFEGICRVAVQFGQMKMAWIGIEDEREKLITPVAVFGEATDYLQGLVISTRADLPEGRGPTGTAFRENRPVFVGDAQQAGSLAAWRRRVAQYRWGSSGSIPIVRNGRPYAVLSFYDFAAQSFPPKVVEILLEMAAEIEYALVRLDLQSEHRRTEQELRIAAIAFQSQEAIVVTDTAGNVLRVNESFARLTGYGPQEVLGSPPYVLKSDRHPDGFYEDIWRDLGRRGRWQGELWIVRKGGKAYPSWLCVSSVRGDGGELTHYVGSFTDISAWKSAEERIERMAYYDALTDLPNRQLLMDRLKHAVLATARNGAHGAALFLDLDQFKTVNDTLGHEEGDKLLQETARRLKQTVREIDTVARFGGDEFVVLLEDLGNQRDQAAVAAKRVADKLLESLSHPFMLQGKAFSCSASIGVALWRGSLKVDVHELLKRSDVAMYEAKRAGRNAVRFFDPSTQIALEERTRLESRLRVALSLNQFALFYQKRVDAGARTLGAEALLRWSDPERGMVPPGEFISIAEESGLIIPIGRWVLQTACTQLRKWADHEATCGLGLSVNISPRQFAEDRFVSEVSDVLAETGADPRLLELEITEGLLMRDIEGVVEKLRALRRLGVSFALDDFGTGYSSLSYLQRLPLHVLKIDQSFVRDMLKSRNSEAIVRTIIQMGQSLGLEVVAEGVETEPQRAMLADRGCLIYQGFLFGKPVPVETFESELATSEVGAPGLKS